MRLTKVSFPNTRSFSGFFLDYIQQNEKLKEFYEQFPAIENFDVQIRKKKKTFTQEQRILLVTTLSKQYEGIQTTDTVKSNIELLKNENTFTVVTGHQLNIFGGPLYFIYKIITVINACKKLKTQYPDYDFVPVFWMASEDHDYDEIKSFRLYGKKYIWNTQQSGAVGRFSTDGFDELLRSVPGDTSIFKKAYLESKTLSEAVRRYVNDLFSKEGLLVIDADDSGLKTSFKPVIKDDLIQHSARGIVDTTNQKLEALGHKTQVYCREVNFFYLDEQLRNRIERDGEDFKVVDTDKQFSRADIEQEIEQNPEKFSPNVILRPLYQEMVLPNLAYVGGPAEMVYWLQLKNVFEQYHTPFPILLPRNFALVIESHIWKKFKKTGLEVVDLFEEKNNLFNHWALKNSNHKLTTSEEQVEIQRRFAELEDRAGAIDVSLIRFIAAEGKRALNSMDKIEKKMLRAEKRRQADKLGQIEAVKDHLFPNGSLQERVDNFLNFYQNDPQFIDTLMKSFDPFDFQFYVLTYDS